MHRPPVATEPPRWDDLQVFLAVMRGGSFSAAAAELRVEQSTVSRRIAKLEQALGALLFDRLAQGPRPTHVAELLRSHAERVEAEVNAFSDTATGHGRAIEGRVRLALPESFAVHVVIPELLPPLRSLHPGLRIDLVTSDLAADLARREADIALRFFRPVQGDLLAKRIARLPTGVLAHRSYAQRSALTVADLEWIVLELPGAVGPDAAFLGEHFNVTPVLSTTSHLAQVEAVRAGLGVALLARALKRLVPDLVELELQMPAGPVIELWLVTPPTLRAVPRVNAVWEFLEARLSAFDE